MYMVVQITRNSCLKLIEGEIEIKLFMIQLVEFRNKRPSMYSRYYT